MKKLGPLYGITGKTSLERIERAILGGVNVLQLREKRANPAELKDFAIKVKRMCKVYSCVFILNDDPYLAKAINSDGVHLGREDLNPESARKFLGKGKIIGISAYNSLERALKYQDEVDYISFSSPYPSPTKEKPITPFSSLEKAGKILSKPFYVIGGITDKNVEDVLKTGAFGVAVISYIFRSEDPFFPAFQLREKIISLSRHPITL